MGPVDSGLPGRGGQKPPTLHLSRAEYSRGPAQLCPADNNGPAGFPGWAQSAGVLGSAHHEGCWDGAGAYRMTHIISNTFGVCLGIFRHHLVQKIRFTAES